MEVQSKLKTFFKSPYWLLILSTLFWSCNFVVGRAVQNSISPISLSFWRWFIAFLIILPFAFSHLYRQKDLILLHWKILTLLSILSISCFTPFVYMGLQKTTATNGVLLFSVSPVIILLLSLILLGQKIRKLQVIGVLFSSIGVILIVTKSDLSLLFDISLNIGDLWIIASVFIWGLYSVCLKWRPGGIHPLSFISVIIAIGLLVLFPFFLWELKHLTPISFNSSSLMAVIFLAIFPSILAYIFWNAGVAKIGANYAGQFLHLIPFFGTLLSIVILGEKLHLYHFYSILFIATGIYLATSKTLKRVFN